MTLTKTRVGELFVLTEAFLWSLFPVITILTFSAMGPLFSLVFARLFLHERIMAYQIAAFVPIFIGVVLLTKSRNEEGRTGTI
ncbi:EamA family transporter [Candidatus Peregrinibacteria bacterium]|nr:EamA family transporter [Candidatus Peregrinibacteria bacterium]MBI3816730.1 EamA family transporter [Candidatus Peregrinibacteria bacterium]